MAIALSELLGSLRLVAVAPPVAGGIGTASRFAALEVVAPFTRLALDVRDRVGPHLVNHRRCRMTSDWYGSGLPAPGAGLVRLRTLRVARVRRGTCG